MEINGNSSLKMRRVGIILCFLSLLLFNVFMN